MKPSLGAAVQRAKEPVKPKREKLYNSKSTPCFSGAVFGLARAASRSGRGAEKNLRREVGFVGSIGSKEGERRLSATLPTVDKVTSNEGVAAIRKVVIA